MTRGKILGPNSANAVEVCEVMDDEVSGFAGGDFAFGFGIENEMTAPVGEPVGAIRTRGVGLAGELGHAVFVVDMVVREREKFGELVVEVGFGKRVGSSFVTTGFEEVGA